jgi:apolipoprotein N-acyltransferase
MKMALAASMPISAYLMASAAVSPQHALLGFLTLLPLFAAIQALAPLGAALCGALWGASVFVFGAYGLGDPLILPPTAVAFVVLSTLPAIYAGGGAWLTRRIGFSPFVLGVGWMVVELALAPLSLHNGLLAGTQGDTALMDYLGRALGYVLVAFLVAYVNAALVAVLGRVRLSVPRFVPTAASPDWGRFLISQILGCLSLVVLQPSRPRAPPL